MSLIKKAKSASNQLLLVSTIIVALSAVGAVAMTLIAFVVFSDDVLTRVILVSVAIVQFLVVSLFGALASAVSAGLDLRIAQHQFSFSGAEHQSNSTSAAETSLVKLSTAESKKIKKLTDEQLTEWILQNQPSLTDWDPETSFDEWLSRNVEGRNY